MTAQIVIDCSTARHKTPGGHPELERLMHSVRELSSDSSVHVYLRSQISGYVPRRYQVLLQSYGCRVTARMGA